VGAGDSPRLAESKTVVRDMGGSGAALELTSRGVSWHKEIPSIRPDLEERQHACEVAATLRKPAPVGLAMPGSLTRTPSSSLRIPLVIWTALCAITSHEGLALPSQETKESAAGARHLHGRRFEIPPSPYGEHSKGQLTAEAVRNASLNVLKARRAKGKSTHPFYWGAFVAAGDWR